MAEGVGYAEPEFGRCLLRPTAEHFQWIAGYILCWLESLLDHRGHAGSVDDESRAVRALYVTVEALREIGEPDADTDTTLVAWEKLQRIAQRWADQEDWVPWFSPHFPVRRLADVLPVA